MSKNAVKIFAFFQEGSPVCDEIEKNLAPEYTIVRVNAPDDVKKNIDKDTASLLMIDAEHPLFESGAGQSRFATCEVCKSMAALIFAGQVAIHEVLSICSVFEVSDFIAGSFNAELLSFKMSQLLKLQKYVSQTQKYELKIQQLKGKCKDREKELADFIYVASHDLQEPVRMVASYTQLLDRRYKDKLDSDANDFIYFAVDGADRLKRMIDDLLKYSRVGTHGNPFAPVDMNFVVSQAIKNLEISIQDSLAIIAHEFLPTVHADKTQLIQLFQNLIENSIKFRGEDKPEIHVKVIEMENEWRFSVQDNGIGFDPEHKERIFTAFQRLHARGEYEGNGIGLAVCKRIVNRHGGNIYADARPDEGATFHFTLLKEI